MKAITTNIPLVIFVYNRVDTVKRLIDIVRQIRFDKIYIIADGPSDPSEKQVCRNVLNLIRAQLSAQKLIFDISTKHLGLRDRIITGLNRVFAHEEMATILEDDCLPDLSFFRFVETLLKKYRHDTRVISIAGYTDLPNLVGDSYTFSRYIESWGWATWRRAWKNLRLDMHDWPTNKKNGWLNKIFSNPFSVLYWRLVFDLNYHGRKKSWAYRWMYAAFKYNGLTIVPQINMIENIGFGVKATNTRYVSGLGKRQATLFPLRHPQTVKRDVRYDKAYERRLLLNPYAWLGIVKSLII